MLLLLSLVLTVACARGEPIVIGYSNCLDVAGYSMAQMNEIAQLKWYFAHASVGGNMMDGIADLHAVSSQYYPLASAAAGEVPPAATQTGVVYQHDRGNPGWQAKVDTFLTCANNGWRFPKVNLAVNKFCYIDQDANLDYYLGSMTNLEAAFPETVFVYMTMPLTTSADGDNYLRNVFNDGLRDWVRANSRVLYDIADIEAHGTNGALCLFTNNHRACQLLYSGYSSDGGHLNTAGRQLVAKGFYALASALMSADRDGDGLSDGKELVAGTRPVDAQSGFKFARPIISTPGTVSLQWHSRSNRLYTLQRATSLSTPGNFTNVLVNAPATPPMNTYTDTPPNTGAVFYRISVRQ